MSILIALAAAAASLAPLAQPSLSSAAGPPPTAAPIQETACASGSNCRHIDQVGMVVSPTQTITVKIGADLPYMSADGLTLALGESVTLAFQGGDGQAQLSLVSSGRAAADQLSPLIKAGLHQPTPANPQLPTPPAGQIRISLLQAPGRPDIFLFVENGLDKLVGYTAELVSVDNVGVPTTVCPVLAGRIGVQYWPNAAPMIRLRNFGWAPDESCH